MQPLQKTVWRSLKKLKIELPYNPAIPLLDIQPKKKENTNLKRYMHTNVHGSTIYNSQDMEATCVHQQMNGQRRCDTYIYIYIYHGIYTHTHTHTHTHTMEWNIKP